MARMVGSPHQS